MKKKADLSFVIDKKLQVSSHWSSNVFELEFFDDRSEQNKVKDGVILDRSQLKANKYLRLKFI